MSGTANVTSSEWAKVLARCFMSDNVSLRLKAAEDAVDCRSSKVAYVLDSQLNREPSALVRSSIVWSLGLVGREKYLPQIVRALRDPEWRVRSTALRTLAEFCTTPDVVVHVVQRIVDPHARVRGTAFRLLAAVDEETLLETVMAVLTQQDHPHQYAALHLIERAYDRRKKPLDYWTDRSGPCPVDLAGVSDKDCMELARGAFTANQRDVRLKAVSTLFRMNASGVARARHSLDQLDGGSGDLAEAVAVLAKLHSPAAEERQDAVKTLMDDGATDYVPLISDRLRAEKELSVCNITMRALGKLGGDREVALLHEHLLHGELDERIAAMDALGLLGTERARQVIEPYVRTSNRKLRERAAQILSSTRRAALVAVLNNPDGYVRVTALNALAAHGLEDNLLPAILEMVDDPIPEVRAQVIATIKAQEISRIEGMLRTMMSSTDSGLMRRARRIALEHVKEGLVSPSFLPSDLSRYEETEDIAAPVESIEEPVDQGQAVFDFLARSVPDRYDIKQELGIGGMALVCRAIDTETNREVALKILSPMLSMDNEYRKRFRQEAQTLLALDHPHIVHFWDVGGDVLPYIAMEFVNGRSMAEILEEEVHPLSYYIKIATQICAALSYAHTQEVIHRDIKPDNVLVDDAGQVKLIDFGLAKVHDEEKLRRSSGLVGTLAYIAPEQFLEQPVDQRSDIYSFGITLYRMVTGVLPFGGAPYAHLFGPPEDPATLNTDVGPTLRAIILKCIEKEPNERYEHCQAIMTDLAKAAAEL